MQEVKLNIIRTYSPKWAVITKRMKDIPERLCQQKTSHYQTLGAILQHSKHIKNNILETDSDLERSMTIFQGVKKMLAPCAELHYKKKSRKALFKLLIIFSKKWNTNF